MKLVLPGMNEVFCLKKEVLNSLVVENPSLFCHMIYDVKKQLNKQDGEAVLSYHNEPLKIYEMVDMLTDICGINLNTKEVLAKLVEELSKNAVDEVHYEKTMQMLAMLQNYMNELLMDFDCEIACSDILPKQMIKAMHIFVVDDTEEITEKILRYLELIRQFKGDKLFIFVNFRGFIEQSKFELLAETLKEHDYWTLFMDNKDYPKTKNENRVTIDIDLCEF